MNKYQRCLVALSALGFGVFSSPVMADHSVEEFPGHSESRESEPVGSFRTETGIQVVFVQLPDSEIATGVQVPPNTYNLVSELIEQESASPYELWKIFNNKEAVPEILSRDQIRKGRSLELNETLKAVETEPSAGYYGHLYYYQSCGASHKDWFHQTSAELNASYWYLKTFHSKQERKGIMLNQVGQQMRSSVCLINSGSGYNGFHAVFSYEELAVIFAWYIHEHFLNIVYAPYGDDGDIYDVLYDAYGSSKADDFIFGLIRFKA